MERSWDGIVWYSFVVRSVLPSHKTVDSFDGVTHLLIVDRIVHILTVLVCNQNSCVLQYPKVLRSNGLLNLEGVVNLIDLDILVLIQKPLFNHTLGAMRHY